MFNPLHYFIGKTNWRVAWWSFVCMFSCRLACRGSSTDIWAHNSINQSEDQNDYYQATNWCVCYDYSGRCILSKAKVIRWHPTLGGRPGRRSFNKCILNFRGVTDLNCLRAQLHSKIYDVTRVILKVNFYFVVKLYMLKWLLPHFPN